MTKDKMIVYHTACYGIPEGDEYMTWLSHWKLGSHEVGPGDEVNISIFNCDDDQNFEVKELGVYLVYEEQEQADVHLAKQRMIQQTCEKISQYAIPVEVLPWAHHGTTRLYFIGCCGENTDSWLEKYFGKYVLLETGDPLSPDSELD